MGGQPSLTCAPYRVSPGHMHFGVVFWLSGVCSAWFLVFFLSTFPQSSPCRHQGPESPFNLPRTRPVSSRPLNPRLPPPRLNSQPLKPYFEISSPSGRVGVSDTFPTLWAPQTLSFWGREGHPVPVGPLTCSGVTLFWSHGSFPAQTSDFKIICAFKLLAPRGPLIPHTCISRIAALPRHTGNCGLSGHLIHGCCDERSRLCLGQRPDL